jgi:hypothetical protein
VGEWIAGVTSMLGHLVYNRPVNDGETWTPQPGLLRRLMQALFGRKS